MSRMYTAQELREAADYFAVGGGHDLLDGKTTLLSLGKEDVAAMLRQAADMMEREKKYEYTVIAKRHDGGVFIDTEHFSTLESAKKNAENGFYDVIRYERREVGEWEEVPNEE